jgi:hypothetical protein
VDLIKRMKLGLRLLKSCRCLFIRLVSCTVVSSCAPFVNPTMTTLNKIYHDKTQHPAITPNTGDQPPKKAL